MPSRKQFNSNEEYNAWYREYRARNAEKLRVYSREYNRKFRKRNKNHNEYSKSWTQKFPNKRRAQEKLRYAVEHGKIIKQPCFMCGNKKVVAHHPDYCKPLNILWICHIHHRQIHYGDNRA